MFFSREELLAAAAAPSRPCEPVSITLNGVTKQVYVQGMTGRERDEWERSNMQFKKGKLQPDMDKMGNSRARLAVRCLVDKPGGSRLFTDAEAVMLGNLPAAVLSPIFDKAQELSKVSDEDLEELKNASELVTTADGPGTASS